MIVSTKLRRGGPMLDLDAIEAALKRTVGDGFCVSGPTLECLTAIPELMDEIRRLREVLEAEIVASGNVRSGLAASQDREARLRELCGEAAHCIQHDCETRGFPVYGIAAACEAASKGC